MKSVDLKIRTKQFAHRCVKMALSLPNSFLSNHISKQLIRCSTSVAANYRAACLGQSKKVFVSKISICIEEADESIFWIEFLIDEKLVKENLVEGLRKEAKEITAILISSRKTAMKNLKN